MMAWLQPINTNLRNETLIIMSSVQCKKIYQDLMAENKAKSPTPLKNPKYCKQFP